MKSSFFIYDTYTFWYFIYVRCLWQIWIRIVHICCYCEVIYGQGSVIYALKNPYMNILVIYELKSYIFDGFFKTYMVKLLSYMLWKTKYGYSYHIWTQIVHTYMYDLSSYITRISICGFFKAYMTAPWPHIWLHNNNKYVQFECIYDKNIHVWIFQSINDGTFTIYDFTITTYMYNLSVYMTRISMYGFFKAYMIEPWPYMTSQW